MGKECIYKLIVKIVFLCTQTLRVKYDKIVKIVPTNSVEVISFVVFRPKGRVMAAFLAACVCDTPSSQPKAMMVRNRVVLPCFSL